MTKDPTSAPTRLILGTTAIAIALGVAASCIIPDTGIVVMDPDCGIRWCGRATGAMGINTNDEAVTILDGDGLSPKGCICLTEEEAVTVQNANELDCVTRTTSTACGANPDCDWQVDAHGLGFDVCLPDSPDFQVAWGDIMDTTIQECLDVASDLSIDSSPACAFVSEKPCEGAGCTWDAVSATCSFGHVICTDAPIQAGALFSDGNCGLTQCGPDVETTGYGEDGDDDGDDGDGDEGADTTGAPVDPWGDVPGQISCAGTTCEIDQQLIDDLIAYSYLMLDDSARFQFVSNGMKVTGIDVMEQTGELLDALGFQNNDVVRSVSGIYALNEGALMEISDVLMQSTSTDVVIQRGSSTFTITYEIAG